MRRWALHLLLANAWQQCLPPRAAAAADMLLLLLPVLQREDVSAQVNALNSCYNAGKSGCKVEVAETREIATTPTNV
jgi:hypothetical protein